MRMIDKRVFLLAVIIFISNMVLFSQTTSRQLVMEEDVAESWDSPSKPELYFTHENNSPVRNISWSPIGKYIASSQEDDNIRIWDVEKGIEIKFFEGQSTLYALSWSPNGKYIASCSDGGIKIWDVEKGIEIKFFEEGYTCALSWSPNGKYIATGDYYGTIEILDVYSDSNLKTLEGHSSRVESISWSPDGRYIASGSADGIIKIWDIFAGREIKTLTVTDWVSSVSFSPDGKYLVSSGLNATTRIWDITSGTVIRVLDSLIYEPSWSSDGNHIVGYSSASGGDLIKIFDFNTAQELGSIKVINTICGISCHPYGNYIAAGLYDGTIIVYDLFDYTVVRNLSTHSNAIREVSWNPNKMYIAIRDEAEYVKIYNPFEGSKFNEFECGYGGGISWSPDGEKIASGDNDEIKILDVTNGKVNSLQGDYGFVDCLSWSPDGKYIAGGCCHYNKNWERENFIKIWDAFNGSEVLTFSGHENSITIVSWSPDGKYIASHGCFEHSIKIWDTISGSEIMTLSQPEASFDYISWNPDGKSIVSGMSNGIIKIWDVFTGREIKKLITTGVVTSVSFSPEGKYIASVNAYKIINIWDASNGRKFRSLIGHTDAVSDVSWSHDGKYIVSAGMDNTIKLWDAESGELLYTIINGKDGEYLTYTPEGFFTGTEWACHNLVYIVDGLEVTELTQLYNKLYRPDLIAAKLRGEDISEEAAKVALDSLLSTGTPPKLTFLNVPSKAKAGELSFSFNIKDCGGGIGAVYAAVNGQVKKVSNGIASKPGDVKRMSYTLPLKNGENTIEVYAYNSAGVIESLRTETVVSWDEILDVQRPNLYVLAVGINNYGNGSDLHYAVNDAQSICEMFQKQKSGLYENVYVSLLLNDKGTKKGIEKAFKEISQKITADDVFVFYVSGHGTLCDGDYYYITADFADSFDLDDYGLSKNDMTEYFTPIKARKNLVILDSCHSGATINSGARGISEAVAIKRLVHATGQATLASSADEQFSWEGYDGHGIFTYALLEGLGGKGDMDGDGYVSVTELAIYVEREVPIIAEEKMAQSHTQNPKKELVNQDFPLAGASH